MQALAGFSAFAPKLNLLSCSMENQILRIRSKLNQLKANDPAHLLFGASKHRYSLGHTITEAETATFENRHAIDLPPGYRRFLLELGNGGAGPYYGLETLQDSLYADLDYKIGLIDPAKEFPFTAAWNIDFSDKDEAEYTRLEDEYFDSKYSDGLLRLANFGCGVSINLVVNGREYGNIWVDDRCNDGGIYPEVQFTKGERIDFLTWYERWLDQSLQKFEAPPAPPAVETGESDAAIRELHAEASRLFERRNDDQTIINILIKKGAAPHYAEMILENVKTDRSHQKAYYKHLLLGGFTLATGMIISFGSYYRETPGGIHMILWGIMVAGATLITRGVILFRK